MGLCIYQVSAFLYPLSILWVKERLPNQTNKQTNKEKETPISKMPIENEIALSNEEIVRNMMLFQEEKYPGPSAP